MDQVASPNKRRRFVQASSILKQEANSTNGVDPTYEELIIPSNPMIQPIIAESFVHHVQAAPIIENFSHELVNGYGVLLESKQPGAFALVTRARKHKSPSPEAETEPVAQPNPAQCSRGSGSKDHQKQPLTPPLLGPCPGVGAGGVQEMEELPARAYSSLPAPLSKSRLFGWMRRLLPNGASSKSRVHLLRASACARGDSSALSQSHSQRPPANCSSHSTPPGAPHSPQLPRASLELVSCSSSSSQHVYSSSNGMQLLSHKSSVSLRTRVSGGLLSNAAALYGTLRRSVRGGSGGGEQKLSPARSRVRGRSARDGDGVSVGVSSPSGFVCSSGLGVSQMCTLRLPLAANELVLHSTYDLPCDVNAAPVFSCDSQQLAGGGGIYSTLNELACAASSATPRRGSDSNSTRSLSAHSSAEPEPECERGPGAGAGAGAGDADDEDDIQPYMGIPYRTRRLTMTMP